MRHDAQGVTWPQDSGTQSQQRSSWAAVDLGPFLEGRHVDPVPTVLYRDDRRALLYEGKVNTVAGESESLKSWLLVVAAAEVLAQGGPVVWLDFEDAPASLVARLRAVGCPPAVIADHFSYVRPVDPLPIEQGALAHLITPPPRLAVIDGVTEAMTLLGLNPDKGSADAATFMTRLARPLAAAGAGVVCIDHVSKSTEQRGRYALGAQHKLAAVDGAAYTIELVKPFGHGRHGIAHVRIAKDRPGRVREHCPGTLAADLHLHSEPDGSVRAQLQPPAERQPGEPFRPTAVMEAVSRELEAAPSGLSGRAVEAAVMGRRETARLALELLINAGHVTVEQRGRSHLHRSAKPYRQEQP